jgi:hypothetical protein
MDSSLIVEILIVAVIAGHVVQIVFERDDWPFAAYTMYAHLVGDRRRNPFVPLRPEHAAYEAGFLALVALRDDGSSEVLTRRFMHPLMRPLDRLRVLRMLTDRYKQGGDLRPLASSLGAWIAARDAASEVVALEVQLYLWRSIPALPERHHEPDEVQVLERVQLVS